MKTPKHYDNKVTPLDIIDTCNLNFNTGNTLKYLYRFDKKHNNIEKQIEDLEKAITYLEFEISKRNEAIANIRENWTNINKDIAKLIISMLTPSKEMAISHTLTTIITDLKRKL